MARDLPHPPDEIAKLLARQNDLLADLLDEHRRRRFEPVKVIEKTWLTVSQTADYTGMSETWVRNLRPGAPSGLFSKVKGTLFVNRRVLDRVLGGDLEIE